MGSVWGWDRVRYMELSSQRGPGVDFALVL
jgi:hypothetical protein